MKNREDIDSMDELFRSKLYDFEVETMPDDWEKIEARLPKRNVVPFYHKAVYWAAAAVVALFLITGTIFIMDQQPELEQFAKSAEVVSHDKVSQKNNISAEAFSKDEQNTVVEATMSAFHPQLMLAYVDVDDTDILLQAVDLPQSDVSSASEQNVESEERHATPVHIRSAYRSPSIEEKENEPAVEKHQGGRWKFGMGGGSVSTGTSNTMNTYAFRNTSFSDVDLLSSNALNTRNEEAAKTDIDHNVPISVGIGVSYALSNRFALESGINYSYLHSKWKTNGLYHKTTKQKLHFIGIPLSLSYKIAEWQKIRFYASAGAMAEVNVAGKVSTDSYAGKSKVFSESNNTRMDEWYWSVNARVGASYPLWRYLSLYAEVGTSYYFDNNSEIETIHSSKPFNVNLQAGLRFNL